LAASAPKKPKVVKAPPHPDAVDNRGWKIKESVFGTGSVDFKSSTITVPLTADPDGRMTRNHEMLHVKFSPKSPPKLPEGVDPMVYQACEDYRVNVRGENVGIIQDAPRLNQDDIGKWRAAWKDKPLVAATALMASLTNREDHKALYAAAKEDFDEKEFSELTYARNCAAREINKRRNPGPKSAVTAAQYLSRLLTPPPPPPKSESGDGKSGPDGGEIQKAVDEGNKKLMRMARGGEKSKVIEKMVEHEYRHGSKPELTRVEGTDWGEMRIREMPRPLLFPAKMKSRRWKPTTDGSAFRYPQRWAADMSGFAFKGIKEGGATVLIDVSGSMHLEESQILEIMRYMPASLIATYSGRHTEGELRIIAKKGRRAVERDFRYAGGNVIDGPALLWLAKQKGPRYWVSDGGVTGVHQAMTPTLIAECVLICERYHIMRIDSVDEVVQQFKQFRKA
jgi:hypothetical protein